MKIALDHPGTPAASHAGAAPTRCLGSERGAFSLIEVMIAMGIFFMAVFTILALVSNTLKNARALQRPQVDAGMAASVFVNTNRFPEGSRSGDFEDQPRDFHWEANTYEAASNGLMQADIVLLNRNGHGPPETLNILVFDGTSGGLPFGGGTRPR